MKLIDFNKFQPFIELRKKMKADITNWTPDIDWNSFLRGQVEIEVDIDDVHAAPDETLEYKGEKVILYIRDQYASNKRIGEYRYHVSWCSTLQEMKKNNRFNARYVISRRRTGFFVVNRINKKTRKVDEGLEIKMNVCKNCLRKLNYKGYNDTGSNTRLYNNFSLDEFFKIYDSQFSFKPKNNEYTDPLNVYAKNFREISLIYRKSVNWICESCGRACASRKEDLHCHHKDNRKDNNDPSNLKALCYKCHSEIPGHGLMKKRGK